MEDRADEPVVAEAIAYPDGQTNPATGDFFRQLAFGKTQGIGVELIRSLRELGDPGKLRGVRFRNLDPQIQSAQEIGEARGGGTKVAALRFLAVEFGAGGVVGCGRERVERPEVCEKGGELVRVLGQG